MPVDIPSLLAHIEQLLDDDDAERALERALSVLAEVGVARVEHAPDDPFIAIERGTQRLVLVTERAAELGGLEPRLSRLLALALRRIDESLRLRTVSERMEMLWSASFEGLFFHVDGVVIDANQRVAELLRCSYEEVLGEKTMRECVAPEDLPSVVERVKSRFEGAYVITAVRKDGTRFRAELQSKQGKLGERPVRVAAVRDVSERDRTWLLLLENEARLRDLARAAFDFIVSSRDGVIVDIGGPFEELLGVTREEALGHHVREFIAESSQPITAQRIEKMRWGPTRWSS
ncbi:MAG: PAS domain S-box protein [Polyangiaceae bacterium]